MNTMAREIQTSEDREQLKTQPKTTRTAGRAESLADRIEEGAASLAAFAEGLSEEEWRTAVSENGGGRPFDRRHRAPCCQRLPYRD
jgi:hypothetical protein